MKKPTASPRAKSGAITSTSWSRVLSAYHSNRDAAEFERERRRSFACRRQLSALFSAEEIARAGEVIARLRDKFHVSNLTLKADAVRWMKNKVAFRQQLGRELGRVLPKYRMRQKLMREYANASKALSDKRRSRLHNLPGQIDLSDVVAPDSGATENFTVPFELAYAEHEEDGSTIAHDVSYVFPATGQVVNAFGFRQEDDGPIVADAFFLTWPTRFSSWAGTGVTYYPKRSGVLRVGAAFQSVDSRLHGGIVDYFGFSEAELEIDLCLYIALIQHDQVREIRKPLLFAKVVSDGDDTPFTLPTFSRSRLYTIEGPAGHVVKTKNIT